MFVRIHTRKHHTDIKQLKEPKSCRGLNKNDDKWRTNTEKLPATQQDADKYRKSGRAQFRMWYRAQFRMWLTRYPMDD